MDGWIKRLVDGSMDKSMGQKDRREVFAWIIGTNQKSSLTCVAQKNVKTFVGFEVLFVKFLSIAPLFHFYELKSKV